MELPQGKIMVRGDLLPTTIQDHCLRVYVHRFTRQHVPQWARRLMPNGRAYPVQFASDSEWLARTLFPVTVKANGVIERRWGDCQSNPTWPDGLNEQEAARIGFRVVDVPEYEELNQ